MIWKIFPIQEIAKDFPGSLKVTEVFSTLMAIELTK